MENLIKEVLKANTYRNSAWTNVVEKSRKYMMMKQTGRYIDGNGNMISVSDKSAHEEMFKNDVLFAIEDAFLEDTLVGIAVGKTKMSEKE